MLGIDFQCFLYLGRFSFRLFIIFSFFFMLDYIFFPEGTQDVSQSYLFAPLRSTACGLRTADSGNEVIEREMADECIEAENNFVEAAKNFVEAENKFVVAANTLSRQRITLLRQQKTLSRRRTNLSRQRASLYR